MWIAPFLISGIYLLVAWQLRRWNEAELLFVVGASLLSGLAGVAMLPIVRWQRVCLATLYLPVMGLFLLLSAYTGLGCGVFGHCL